jgi:ribosomal biogenesis protein LAS1
VGLSNFISASKFDANSYLSVSYEVVFFGLKVIFTYIGESYGCRLDDPFKVKRLCSLVLWLVTNIKELKNSGYLGLIHEIGVLSSEKNAVPRFCLAKLLQKLLSLSTTGERCIIHSALLLIEMVNNNNVREKLRKLPVLSLERLGKVSSLSESRTIPSEQESIENVTEMMEMLKSQLKMRTNACSAENGSEGLSKRWSIVKSWTPCPIGTVPCSFSSTTVLPAFDVADDELENAMVEQHENLEDHHFKKFETRSEELEDERMLEVSTPSREYEIPDMAELMFPLKGRLLVGGVWKQMTGEELQFMKSEMKILL